LVCAAAVNLAMNEWGDEVFDRIAKAYILKSVEKA